jgi:hypothetical protein
LKPQDLFRAAMEFLYLLILIANQISWEEEKCIDIYVLSVGCFAG